jgi:hypothetical protein
VEAEHVGTFMHASMFERVLPVVGPAQEGTVWNILRGPDGRTCACRPGLPVWECARGKLPGVGSLCNTDADARGALQNSALEVGVGAARRCTSPTSASTFAQAAVTRQCLEIVAAAERLDVDGHAFDI